MEQQQAEAGWNWDNTYGSLPSLLYTRMGPEPVQKPGIAVVNEALAAVMGLDVEGLKGEVGAAVLAGNLIPEGADPMAQAYAGHQFGYFNRLGDGRALLLGEHVTPQGQRYDIQLKGSGRTPYSRNGDGRAALGPMLREYIISEAMHGLGIPTTRSLAVAITGERIARERMLPGAVLTRVAASHIRVGTFQYAAKWGSRQDVETLAEYVLQRHYPHAQTEGNRSLLLLREVIGRQAELIARWMLVGFIHGVMNTDNMAVSGETIDYGPCAFMDAYDPGTVFSSIDREGRYAYGNQPSIAVWNLARFAETLLPLLHDTKEEAISLAKQELERFEELYQQHWLGGMAAKLGLFQAEPGDEELFRGLLELMQEHSADYTDTFRQLTMGRNEGMALSCHPAFRTWQDSWQARLGKQGRTEEETKALMRRSNPAVIARNHRVEEALQEASDRGDYAALNRLLSVLSDPYAYSPEQEAFGGAPETAAPYVTYCGT